MKVAFGIVEWDSIFIIRKRLVTLSLELHIQHDSSGHIYFKIDEISQTIIKLCVVFWEREKCKQHYLICRCFFILSIILHRNQQF